MFFLKKVLAVVVFLSITSFSSHASEFDSASSTFGKVQGELWFNGFSVDEDGDEMGLSRRMRAASNVSAIDLYPEELTRALDRLSGL